MRYLIGLILQNVFRWAKVLPNSDPIMGFILPAAKNEAWWKAPAFAFIAMFSFDILMGAYGIWTWATSITYAVLALAFYLILRKQKKAGLRTFIGFGSVGVLVFDFITGPVLSSVMFGMSFGEAFLGQIPFTLLHLGTAVMGIVVITPFYDPVVAKELQGAAVTIQNKVFSLWRFIK